MEQIITQFSNSLGGSLSSVLGAIVFLVIGWIFALIAGSLVRKLMASININGRFNQNNQSGKGLDLEKIASRLAFWFIFIFAITGALNKLELNSVSAPLANLLNQVTSFIPSLIGAAIVGLVGWVIATLAKTGITKVMSATSLDEKLSKDAGVPPMSNTIGSLFYWLIILMFIPMVLDKLGLKGLLAPVQNMIDEILAFLPNLFGALIIAGVGYVIAKVLRGIVTNLVSTLNVQALANKAGLKGTANIANASGMIVFLLIMIPVLIASLDKLQVEAISRPATNMLEQIMTAIPNIIAAGVILAIFYYVFRFISNIVTSLLENVGVNELPAKMGMAQLFGETKVSGLVGYLIMFFAMLFAVIEATNRLGFNHMGDILTNFISFGGSILLGGVILMIGFWLANTVANIVARSQPGSAWLGSFVKVVIMGLVLAMGLRSMGIADSIVNMAFGLTLGGAAVAFALAFGLGGREAAARILKNALDKIEQK